jgi:hypothetical protein
MRLWIESAQQTLPEAVGKPAGEYVRTLTTEGWFLGLVRDPALPWGEGWSTEGGAAQEVISALERGAPLKAVATTLLTTLPEGVHLPLAVLQVCGGSRASLFECDAPPLFMARRGRLVLLPVVEEEYAGRLIRSCEFELQDGDHMAIVNEGFLRGVRWDRRWTWRDIAVATRRLTETRCDARQLAGALIRQHQRRGIREDREARRGGEGEQGGRGEATQHKPCAISHQPSAISVLAMFVRPMRSITLWSGPPASRAAEREVLDKLMDEEDVRVICGDTTAEIAARLLGAQLVIERRPPDGWREVPPASRMIGPTGTEEVDLVTEGVVTMTVARGRLASAHDASGLAGQEDGASRLAQMLLTADRVQFLVGLAVNPVQVAADGTPIRRSIVEALVSDLRERGKIVSVRYF